MLGSHHSTRNCIQGCNVSKVKNRCLKQSDQRNVSVEKPLNLRFLKYIKRLHVLSKQVNFRADKKILK